MKPLTTVSRFIRAHLRLHQQLRDYSLTARGRRVVDELTMHRLQVRAGSLYATNARARIEFMMEAVKAFGEVASCRAAEDFYFVTLIPQMFAVPSNEAKSFDHELVKEWTSQILDGFDYIGVVEAALYTNANMIPGSAGPMVSWHVHAVVWGCTEDEVRHVEKTVNKEHAALLPGRPAAKVDRHSSAKIGSRVIYMLKAPHLTEYRVWPTKREVADRETGEICKEATGRFRQRKRRARLRDSISICKLMADRTIPMLTFSGGEGDQLWVETERHTIARIAQQDAEFLRDLSPLHDWPGPELMRSLT